VAKYFIEPYSAAYKFGRQALESAQVSNVLTLLN